MMWLINWIGLTIVNIVIAYCMFFGVGGIVGYILGGIFMINTGVILHMWYNWPEEKFKDAGDNKFGRKTPTVMKHTYSNKKRYY